MSGATRSRGDQDLELLAAAGVLALALAGLGGVLLARAHRLAGHATGWTGLAHGWGRPLLALLLASAALLVLACVARSLCTWWTLGSRVAYVALPPDAFDPRPEAIEAFGQQLLGARRRVLGWLDRPACALRIQLTTTGDGRLVYVLELPARFRGTLLNACTSAYPGVELRSLAEPLTEES